MRFGSTLASPCLHALLAAVVVLCAAGCNSPGAADNARPSAAVPEEKPAAALVKPAVPAAAAESFATFEAYWPVFHAAVQKGDKEKVASLTRFPFETRGDSDDSPLQKLSREQFLQAFDSMLSEDPGLLMNGKETQREHIARSATLAPRQYVSGDTSARIGVFQFDKEGDRWWFTRAYVSDE